MAFMRRRRRLGRFASRLQSLALLLYVSTAVRTFHLCKKFSVAIFTKERRRDLPQTTSNGSVQNDGATTITVSKEEEEEEEDTYTLVVVRCKGDVQKWLKDVPEDWRIIVYEKCTKELTTKYSVNTAINNGAEECNGYVDYMYDYYNNLTTTTVFFHDDGLTPYDTKHEAHLLHTNFSHFDQVVDVTKRFVTKNQAYVSFGVTTLGDTFGTDEYHGEAQKVLWPLIVHSSNTTVKNPPSSITFKPSAHMAVRKEAIQRHPRETYAGLLAQFRNVPNNDIFVESDDDGDDDYDDDEYDYITNSRPLCCAMERMWHIFFGQPAILPRSAMVTDILREEATRESSARESSMLARLWMVAQQLLGFTTANHIPN